MLNTQINTAVINKSQPPKRVYECRSLWRNDMVEIRANEIENVSKVVVTIKETDLSFRLFISFEPLYCFLHLPS